MDIQIGKLHLLTNDKNKLIRFISFVFDSEVYTDVHNNSYTKVGEIKVFFIDKDNQKIPSSPFFTFTTYDHDELINFKSKVELYYYREGLPKPKFDLDSDSILFKDFDGNSWHIEYQRIVDQNNTVDFSQNVRNY